MTAPAIVRDGVVDIESYRKARLRIVWFLREFNDPAQKWDGSICDVLSSFARDESIHHHWRFTYGTVAQVTYGLLHPDEPWETWSSDEARYAPMLNQIAVVNVKKIAGRSVAVWKQLEQH